MESGPIRAAQGGGGAVAQLAMVESHSHKALRNPRYAQGAGDDRGQPVHQSYQAQFSPAARLVLEPHM